MIVRAGNPNYKLVHFSWFFTNWCNYSCQYCSSKSRMVSDWSKVDSISKYKIVLARLKGVDTDFAVDLFGGEPTLHPNIEEVLHELKQMPRCKGILISTNLSRSIDFYKKFDQPEFSGITLAGSFHPEYFTDEFANKALTLKSIKYPTFSLTIILSDKPEYWDKTLEFIKLVKEHGMEYSLQMLTPTPTYQPNYTSDFFKLFQSELDHWTETMTNKYKDVSLAHRYEFEDGSVSMLNEFQIYEKNYYYFKGYSCTPLFYEINTDGEIYNLCTSKKIIKMMPKSTDLIKQEVCPKDFCSCETMFNFYKEKKK